MIKNFEIYIDARQSIDHPPKSKTKENQSVASHQPAPSFSSTPPASNPSLVRRQLPKDAGRSRFTPPLSGSQESSSTQRAATPSASPPEARLLPLHGFTRRRHPLFHNPVAAAAPISSSMGQWRLLTHHLTTAGIACHVHGGIPSHGTRRSGSTHRHPWDGSPPPAVGRAQLPRPCTAGWTHFLHLV